MDLFFVILLAVVILIVLFRHQIFAWLQRRAVRRVMKMMGVGDMDGGKDSRAESQRRSQRQERRSHAEEEDSARMMHEVAEDVEFTEIKEYSEEIEITGDGKTRQQHIYREDQVSDAEYEIVKDAEKGGKR